MSRARAAHPCRHGASVMATALPAEKHAQVRSLCLAYDKGDEDSKQVFIRDQLDEIFKPYQLHWRLTPKEVGIHPANRDGSTFTASAVQRSVPLLGA